MKWKKILQAHYSSILQEWYVHFGKISNIDIYKYYLKFSSKIKYLNKSKNVCAY